MTVAAAQGEEALSRYSTQSYAALFGVYIAYVSSILPIDGFSLKEL